MKSIRNGIAEFVDDKDVDHGFFCMKLVSFLNEEAEIGSELHKQLWRKRFDSAIAGQCFYRDKCPIYDKTSKRYSIQLLIDFD